MPAAIEIVEPIVVVRDLHDDEKLVCDDFERHASHCSHCTLAIERFNNNLCERGHLLAVDVTKYLYSESGKHFSVVDRESGKSRRVKLPRDTSFVRALLDSVEAGMRLRRGRAPAVRPLSRSFDTTLEVHTSRRPIVEQVRPRSRTPETSPKPDEIIERSPSAGKRHVIVYHSPRGSPNRSSSSRGSLYTADHIDRLERHTTRRYRVSDYYK